MHRILFLILAIAATIPAVAAKYSHRFHNVPVAQALVQVIREHPELSISFIYNELESYKANTATDSDDPEMMLRDIIGLNPISLITINGHYYLEALQHGRYCYRGRVIDQSGEPATGTTIMLLSRKDSTVITYAVADSQGQFMIPCDSRNVIAKLSCLGYKTVYHNCRSFNVGTIVMSFDAVALKQVTVEGETAAAYSDRTVYIPNTRQKKASQDAIDLLQRMAIPQINIDPRSQSVTDNSGASVAIYINGMKAAKDELQGMRTTDAKRVEYLEYPSDAQFIGASKVINIITQQYEYGGYTKATVKENALAETLSEENLFSTFSYRKMKYDLYAGAAHQDSRHDGSSADTRYSLTDGGGNPYEVHRMEDVDGSHARGNKFPLNFRASYNGEKMKLRNSVGFTHVANKIRQQKGSLAYAPATGNDYTYEKNNPKRRNQLSYKGDWLFMFPKEVVLKVASNLSYTHTIEKYDYKPSDASPVSRHAAEDATEMRADLTLAKRFGKFHTLTLNALIGNHANDVEYTGTDNYNDKFNLWGYAALIGYNLNTKKLSLSADAGFIAERSEINGEVTNDPYPSTHLNAQYAFNRKNKLNVFFQYASFSTEVSDRSTAVLKNNDFYYITGNPNLVSSRLVELHADYTWLPSNNFSINVFGSYERIGDRLTSVYEPYKDGTAILRRFDNSGHYADFNIGTKARLKLIGGNLQLSVRPSWTNYRLTGIYAQTYNAFSLEAQANAYAGPFNFSAYYYAAKRNLDKTTTAITTARPFYYVYAGWANQSWNIRLTAYNLLNKGWKDTTSTIDTPHYGAKTTSYSVDYHARLQLSVTYTIGYGKKVNRGNEIGEQEEAASAILK